MLEISVTKTKRIHSSIQTKGIKESHQIKFFKLEINLEKEYL